MSLRNDRGMRGWERRTGLCTVAECTRKTVVKIMLMIVAVCHVVWTLALSHLALCCAPRHTHPTHPPSPPPPPPPKLQDILTHLPTYLPCRPHTSLTLPCHILFTLYTASFSCHSSLPHSPPTLHPGSFSSHNVANFESFRKDEEQIWKVTFTDNILLIFQVQKS
ncbi:hypothetical protein Pmani_028754 [Petrolisthes manimaculis]|uniref:Uncharacterized protein n=1 Tax=Petrolisthes manimaculis TaxID=1843537 RepID=A0AAE1P100_9EUCA|nr:hypothetical protein Pmani_028754 [Petrolisthes manimaculis]